MMYSSGIREATFCKIDLHLSDEDSVSIQDTGQSDDLDLRDTHVCLICLSSIIGLDNYVDHKKSVCLLSNPRPSSKRAMGCLMEIIGAFTSYSHNLERSLANIGNSFGNCGMNQYGGTPFTASRVSSIQTEEKSDGVEETNQIKNHSSGNGESNSFRDDVDAVAKENTEQLLIKSSNSVNKLESRQTVDDGTVSTNHGNQYNVGDYADFRSEDNQMNLQSPGCSAAKSCILEQCRPVCKVCKKYFRTVSNYEKHMTSQLHLKRCKSSDLSCKNVSIKRKIFPSRKIIENLEIENAKLEKLQCPNCRFLVFQSSFALAKHVLVEHKEEIKFGVFPKALLNRCCKEIACHLPLSCLSCRFFTNRSEDLLSHLNAAVHSGVCSAPFKCTYCAFSTTDVEDLKTHLKCSSHQNKIISKEKECKKYLEYQKVLDSLGLLEKQPRKVSGDLLRTRVNPSRGGYGQHEQVILERDSLIAQEVGTEALLEKGKNDTLNEKNCTDKRLILQEKGNGSLNLEANQIQLTLEESGDVELQKKEVNLKKVDDPPGLENDGFWHSAEENASFTLQKNDNKSSGARKNKDRRYSFENILRFEEEEDNSPGSKEDKDNQTYDLSNYSLVMEKINSLTDLKKGKDNNHSFEVEKHHPLSKKEYEGNCSQYGFQNSLHLKQQHISLNLKENIRCISEANVSLNVEQRKNPLNLKEVENSLCNSENSQLILKLEDSSSHLKEERKKRDISEHTVNQPSCETSSLNVKEKRSGHCSEIFLVHLREQGNSSSMKENERSRHDFKNLDQKTDLPRVEKNKDGRRLSRNASLSLQPEGSLSCVGKNKHRWQSSETLKQEGSPLLLKGHEDKNRYNYENTLDFPEEGITSCDKTDGGSLHSSKNYSLTVKQEGTQSSLKEDQYSWYSSENFKLDFSPKGIASYAKTREDRPLRSKISYDLEEDDNQSPKDDHVGNNCENLSSFQQKVTIPRAKGNEDNDDCYEDSSLKKALPSYLKDEDSRHSYEKSSLNLVEEGSASNLNDEDSRHSYATSSLNLVEEGRTSNLNDENSGNSYEKSSLNLAEEGSSSNLNDEDSRQSYATSSLNLVEEGRASNLNDEDSGNSDEKSSLNLAKEGSSSSLTDEDSRHSYEISSLNSEPEDYSSNWKRFKDSCHNSERSLSSVLKKEEVYPSGLKGSEKSWKSDCSSSLEEDGYCRYNPRARDLLYLVSDQDISSFEGAGKPRFEGAGFDDSFEQTDLKDNSSILKKCTLYGVRENSSNTLEDGISISFGEQDNDEENVEILTDVPPRTEELAVVGSKKAKLVNYCNSCNKMLSSKRSYENHKLSSLHLNKSRQAHKFPWSTKRKWVPSKKYLEVMHDTSTKSMCPKCIGRTFRSPYCLAKHVLMYHKIDIVHHIFQADFMDQCWETLTPRLPFACTFCRFFANRSDDLLTHAKSKGHPIQPSGWLICSCSYKTKRVKLLQQHFLSYDHRKKGKYRWKQKEKKTN